MKTVSSGKDQNVVDVKYLPVEGECSHNNISETLPGQGFNESDNLIKCDSQLASSFQEVKIVKSRLKPGHYLQRVFLHKLKSQSVPSLDKDKIVNQVRESNESVCDENVSPVGKDGEQVTEECDKEVCDSWYRTWPECTGEKARNGFLVVNGGSSDGNRAPEPSVVRLNTAVPLDNLLEALPLAYSPITKQIHLIDRNDVCPGPTDPMPDVPLGPTDPKCDVPTEDLHRVNTELGSFSSTLSSLSDVSPSTNGDSAVSNLFDTADNCSLLSIGNSSIVSEDSADSKPKRKGLSGFFSRGVLGWKGRGGDSGQGWTLFGRPAAQRASSPSISLERRSFGGSDGVLGSTGLIQLERPACLPAKPKQEHKAHVDQHDRILQALRKKEAKEAKLRKRELQSQLKAEDHLVHAVRLWTQEILPNWPQTREEKRTMELWWEGVPPCVRGKLWCLAISNHLNLTHHLYHICLQRAQERLRSGGGPEDCPPGSDREASMELIQLDISRTFPHLAIFQKSGPYYEWLHGLLAAYVCYRPDVGYVQGMSFLAAMLILNMDPPDAFVCFANLLNRPCHRAFYSLDQTQMECYFRAYEELLKENLPRLCGHLTSCGLSPDLYLLDWIYTVFSRAMNIELASRIWDVFLRDGDLFIFRAAIGILKTCEDALMTMDFVTGSQYLTKLPDLEPNLLFSKIASVRMCVGKLSLLEVLSSHSHQPP